MTFNCHSQRQPRHTPYNWYSPLNWRWKSTFYLFSSCYFSKVYLFKASFTMIKVLLTNCFVSTMPFSTYGKCIDCRGFLKSFHLLNRSVMMRSWWRWWTFWFSLFTWRGCYVTFHSGSWPRRWFHRRSCRLTDKLQEKQQKKEFENWTKKVLLFTKRKCAYSIALR